MDTYSSYCIRVLNARHVSWGWCLAASCGSLWREDEETSRWDVTATVSGLSLERGCSLWDDLQRLTGQTLLIALTVTWDEGVTHMQVFLLQPKSLKTKNVSRRPSCRIASKGILLHLRTHAAKHKENPQFHTLYRWDRPIYRWKSFLPLPPVTRAHTTVSHPAPPWFPSTHLAADRNSRSCLPLSVNTDLLKGGHTRTL